MQKYKYRAKNFLLEFFIEFHCKTRKEVIYIDILGLQIIHNKNILLAINNKSKFINTLNYTQKQFGDWLSIHEEVIYKKYKRHLIIKTII